MERGRELEGSPHEMPKHFPECAPEPDVAVGDDTARNSVQADDFVEEESGGVGGVGSFGAGYEMCHLVEPVDDY